MNPPLSHHISHQPVSLNSWFEGHFWDNNQAGFFTVSDTAEILLVRKKEIYDGALPSCNSVAFENLVRLSHLTGEPSEEQRASELSRSFASSVRRSPSGHTWFLCALDSAIGPFNDVVIVGERDAEDTRALIKALRDHYLPRVLVICKQPGNKDFLLADLAPFTSTLNVTGGKATAGLSVVVIPVPCQLQNRIRCLNYWDTQKQKKQKKSKIFQCNKILNPDQSPDK